jgi:periplasmic divalent cation tolerance protein
VRAARQFSTVLVTAPNLKTARRLAKVVVQAKAAACANLIPRIESHYRWHGKLERGNEVLLILKTSKRKFPALERLILDHHPYDTPEILALPISAGTQRYLAWLDANLG